MPRLQAETLFCLKAFCLALHGLATVDLTSFYCTVLTHLIGPHARTLALPLLVRSGSLPFPFCLKLGLRGLVFAVRSSPYPRDGIPDVLA